MPVQSKVDRFKKKKALDSIPDHRAFLEYRWKILGATTENVKAYRRYLLEFELYEKLRWPEDHYKRWERYEKQCKDHESGVKKMEKYEYDVTVMLVRMGARPMYWMGVIDSLVEMGGIEGAEYIKGMKVDVPEDQMSWYDSIKHRKNK